ncbi:hypothetical protein B0H17DRAFT_1144505 [Mycena rosella]|uniref:Uncharacterized protein n=1 Tax=Mycena rosella TaxID=1033263 RepID=A0AAD7G3D1_MYCRO|nr:hypothetical protein B0H17DRAFT_1144505 [Mycena rosella]
MILKIFGWVFEILQNDSNLLLLKGGNFVSKADYTSKGPRSSINMYKSESAQSPQCVHDQLSTAIEGSFVPYSTNNNNVHLHLPLKIDLLYPPPAAQAAYTGEDILKLVLNPQMAAAKAGRWFDNEMYMVSNAPLILRLDNEFVRVTAKRLAGILHRRWSPDTDDIEVAKEMLAE